MHCLNLCSEMKDTPTYSSFTTSIQVSYCRVLWRTAPPPNSRVCSVGTTFSFWSITQLSHQTPDVHLSHLTMVSLVLCTLNSFLPSDSCWTSHVPSPWYNLCESTYRILVNDIMCASKPMMKIYKTGSGKIKRNSNIKTQDASIFFSWRLYQKKYLPNSFKDL